MNCLITRFVMAGGEKRIFADNRADRCEELFGRVVLEHEAAGAGAERLVDVFVEVERRQEQTAASTIRG